MRLPQQLNAGIASGDAVRLTDLSWRRRFGLKGPGAPSWLAAHNCPVPVPANSWQVTDGILGARLATSEFLVEALGSIQQRIVEAAQPLGAPDRPLDVYPVARQDLVVALRGRALGALLRHICSVDFAPLLADPGDAAGPLVLTSMMGVGVIAVPHSIGGERQLALWVDPSFAVYFWSTLLAVAVDLDGGVHLA